MKIGSHYLGGGRCEFVVWAPLIFNMTLLVVAPFRRSIPMNRDQNGYWRMVLDDIYPGSSYFYQLNNTTERPDPASHSQPRGVHGPSQIIDHRAYPWQDSNWDGILPDQRILYELHVGTFSPEGTFEGVTSRLDHFLELGVNTLMLLPVAQFVGDRNWGYDAVSLFAPHHTYGGADGLKHLVDQAHQKGLAVVVDVGYSHLGLEGNYLAEYAPYFVDKYHTPWGKSFNFDDAYSDDVRNFFIENVLYWVNDYHLDGLRIDALHEIVDLSPVHILRELSDAVRGQAKKNKSSFYLISDNDRADMKPLQPITKGGYAFDLQMCEDFHNSLWSLLDSQPLSCYQDYGCFDFFLKSLRDGQAYCGQVSPSRNRSHGGSSAKMSGNRLIIYTQDHTHVGNMFRGARLISRLSAAAQKMAAGLLLVAPAIPQLFMGEEYGESAPFHYFIANEDEVLISVIRESRARDYQDYCDPAAPDTFYQSKINIDQKHTGENLAIFGFYQQLIRLRKTLGSLSVPDKSTQTVVQLGNRPLLMLSRIRQTSQVCMVVSIGSETLTETIPFPPGVWKKQLDAADPAFGGNGSQFPETVSGPISVQVNPYDFVIFEKSL